MARKLMPKSGIMMPYVVANRDAQIVGVQYVDGKTGNVDLSNKYLTIVQAQTDYASINHSYSKTESDGRYLQSHNVLVGYNQPVKAKGIPPAGTDSTELDLIQAADLSVYIRNPSSNVYEKTDTQNAIIVGDLGADVQGVHIRSEGRAGIVYTDTDANGQPQVREAPLYSRRFPPEVQDVPFATIGNYVTDPVTGRVTRVNRTGINSDIKELAGDATTGLKISGKTTFTQPVVVPNAQNDNEAVNLYQAKLLVGSGGGSSTTNGVVGDFLGSIQWWQGDAAAIPTGFLAASGQLVKRTDYPELWAGVKAGIFTVIQSSNGVGVGSDTVWKATRSARGTFSYGYKADGTTEGTIDDGETFRLPDLNGIQTTTSLGGNSTTAPSSIKGLFLRGIGMAGVNGNETGGGPGVIRDSAAPNITGSLDVVIPGNMFLPTGGGSGALSNKNSQTNTANNSWSGLATSNLTTGVAINANKLTNGGNGVGSPGGGSVYRDGTSEVRPNSVQGTWIIRVSANFDSANTNFNVIRGDTTAPASGITASGGAIISDYQVAGVSNTKATFRAQSVGTATAGQFTRSAAIDITDGTGAVKTWSFGNDGSLTAPTLVNFKSNIQAPWIRTSGDMVVGTTGGTTEAGTLYVHGREYIIKNNQYKVAGDAQGYQTNGIRVCNQNAALICDYQLYENRGNFHEASFHIAGAGSDCWFKMRNNGELYWTANRDGKLTLAFANHVPVIIASDGNVQGDAWGGNQTWLRDYINAHGSDRRIKDDIKPIELSDAQKFVQSTQTYEWKYKQDGSYGHGVIADEIDEKLTRDTGTNQTLKLDNVKAVNEGQVALAYLTPVVKDLMDKVEALTKRVAELEAKA